MFNYKKHEIVALAKDNGFRSETLEKVLRLIDVLDFISKTDELSPYLVLKGGTSINFTVFNLPRLSVDIDLDFSFSGTRDEMLEKRKEITDSILRKTTNASANIVAELEKLFTSYGVVNEK